MGGGQDKVLIVHIGGAMHKKKKANKSHLINLEFKTLSVSFGEPLLN